MKKLFYVIAIIIAAITFASCGNKGNKTEVPDSIKELAEKMDASIKANVTGPDQPTYKGIEISGNNIIAILVVDESKCYGYTWVQAYEMMGVSVNEIVRKTKEENLSNGFFDIDVEILRQEKYNMIWRYVGSISGEKVDIVFGHDEWR